MNVCPACERTNTTDEMVELCDACWRVGVRPAPAETEPTDAPEPQLTYRRAGSLKPGTILAITRDRHAEIVSAQHRVNDISTIDLAVRVPEGNTITMSSRVYSKVRVVKKSAPSTPPPGAMTVRVLVAPTGRRNEYRTILGRRTLVYRSATRDEAGIAVLAVLDAAKRCGWVRPEAHAEFDPATAMYQVTVRQ